MKAVSDNRDIDNNDSNHKSTQTGNCQCHIGNNVIEVQACATVTLETDRASVCICVKHVKESCTDVKNSVTRRLEYIIATLKTFGIRDKDLVILKHLTRESNGFRMTAEVTATFLDVSKCLEAVNLLTEKLDKSVEIGKPRFFLSFSKIEKSKQELSLQAVTSAKQKADEIARILQTSLGSPLSLSANESMAKSKDCFVGDGKALGSSHLQQLIYDSTVILKSTVVARFILNKELKSPVRSLRF